MNVPEMSQMDDQEFDNVSLVKVWEPKTDVAFQMTDDMIIPKTGKFDRKGPFYEKTKSEIRTLTKQIYENLNIDWDKPDQVLEVKPKWVPNKQITK